MLLEIDLASAPWKRMHGLKTRLNKAALLVEETLPVSLRKVAEATIIAVRLTSDAEVRKLNKAWRGKDKPTNVLSFPLYEQKDLSGFKKGIGFFCAGDIAVAYGVTKREAEAEDKKILDHLTHLVIHGILHIFGYDHLTEAQAKPMEKMEIKLMAALGVSNPYLEPEEKPKKSKNRKRQ